MKVYVVTVEQHYANHFYVDRVFARKRDAEAYITGDSDRRIEEFEVINFDLPEDAEATPWIGATAPAAPSTSRRVLAQKEPTN